MLDPIPFPNVFLTKKTELAGGIPSEKIYESMGRMTSHIMEIYGISKSCLKPPTSEIHRNTPVDLSILAHLVPY